MRSVINAPTFLIDDALADSYGLSTQPWNCNVSARRAREPLMPFMAPFCRAILLLVVACLVDSRARAAETALQLTVRDVGVYLYSQQDIESPRIATLQKGEALTAVAEAVGTETWYMVRTRQGVVGWVRGSDVTASDQTKETFKEQNASASTWSASESGGRTFAGTWTAATDSAATAASGTWTLQDSSGKTILRGTWTAEKFSTGWNGVWRALVEGRQAEYTGSWSADFADSKNARLADLFRAAAANSVRGIWTGGKASGIWSIRTAK